MTYLFDVKSRLVYQLNEVVIGLLFLSEAIIPGIISFHFNRNT